MSGTPAPCSALQGYAVSGAGPCGREGVFPIHGGCLPHASGPAGPLPAGATWSCGHAPATRVSDKSVGRPPPVVGAPQEAAPARQRTGAAGVTLARSDGTDPERAAARLAAARGCGKSNRHECFRPQLRGAARLTAKGPEVDFDRPKRIMKSNTCEPRRQPYGLDGRGWAVQESTAKRGGRDDPQVVHSSPATSCTLLTSFTRPLCVGSSGGFSPEAELPHAGPRSGRSEMPGGETGRGTRLAVIPSSMVPRRIESVA